jgi:hypothetical protein
MRSTCIYATYDGLLDPLGQSQIIPYLKGLASQDVSFVILSFEKTDHTSNQLQALRQDLEALGARWFPLPFKEGRFEYFKRILKGCWILRRLASYYEPDLVHVRTILPASMVVLAGLKAPLIYDIRAFAGEWIETGRLKKGGPQAFIFNWLENHLISTSAGFVVLDQSGAEYLRQTYPSLRVPIKVIPTCTNLDAFPVTPVSHTPHSRDPYRFVFLGGARFPYRPDLALMLTLQLLAQGIDCTIDFINERDHKVIQTFCTALDFPCTRCHIFSLPQCDVPAALVDYHSGFVFNTSGRWRRMSSPTKLGEYLGAGLHVMGLAGISALDRLADEDSSVVDLFSEPEITAGLSVSRISDFLSHIRNSNRSRRARDLARTHYDMRIAHLAYDNLYQEVLTQAKIISDAPNETGTNY